MISFLDNSEVYCIDQKEVLRSIYAVNIKESAQRLNSVPPSLEGWKALILESLEYTKKTPEYEFLNEVDALGIEAVASAAVGTCRVELTEHGLLLHGSIPGDTPRLLIFVNERLFKILNTSKKNQNGIVSSAFYYTFKNSLLNMLPEVFRVGVASNLGRLKLAVTDATLPNEEFVEFKNPQGKGDIFDILRKDYYITKHGTVQKHLTENMLWQENVLRFYVDFGAYFKRTFGYTLYVVYGSLLGLRRNGEFIPHDDDFDTAYLSSEGTPEGVREELYAISTKIIEDGYKLNVNTNLGSFIRPSLGTANFDVFPGWIEGGKLWMPNTTSIEADRNMFEPFSAVPFKGIEVHIPKDADEFLARKYGAQWRIPDPGYRTLHTPSVLEHLEKARLSIEQRKELEDLSIRVKSRRL